jgi:hypothetical protein
VKGLEGLQNDDSGWAYHPGGMSNAEATVLSCLALLANQPTQLSEGQRGPVRDAADWLVCLQQQDGSLGISKELPVPGWATPYGVLLWSNLKGYEIELQKAIKWLLRQKGKKGTAVDIFGHDLTLQGWSWTANTHSWLEPTALAVLALCRSGLREHRRVQEGLDLILDRAIATGGWNYGNTTVFGKTLRPQPVPTGLALLALANLGSEDERVEAGCSYLAKSLSVSRSPMSLCWGILGLAVWNRKPEESSLWLEQSYRDLEEKPNLLSQIHYLILAGGEDPLPLFFRETAV